MLEKTIDSTLVKKDSAIIKAELSKISVSDVLFTGSKLVIDLLHDVGIVPQNIKSAADVIQFTRDSFGSTVGQRRQLQFIVQLAEELNRLESRVGHIEFSKGFAEKLHQGTVGALKK